MGVPKPNPQQLANDVASLSTDSGGTSGGSLYGASSGTLSAVYNVAGVDALPGLSGAANPTGKQVLQAFVAAGQSTDPAVRNLVSAIEYALYQSGYYTSGGPNLHSVTGHDATALGNALTDLSNVDQTTAGATPGGQITRMSLTQFLTSQAALGATSGPTGPGAATSKTTVIRTPNPADVAAEYERVATSVRGSKPSAAETQAFVRQYIQQSVAAATGATAAKYNALSQQANQHQQQAVSVGEFTGAASIPQIADGSANAAEEGLKTPTLQQAAFDPNASANAAEYTLNATTPDTSLTGAMNTLQDVIGANANTTVQEASPESVDTAAANFARNAHPGAAASNDLGNTLNQFFSILGGIGQ